MAGSSSSSRPSENAGTAASSTAETTPSSSASESSGAAANPMAESTPSRETTESAPELENHATTSAAQSTLSSETIENTGTAAATEVQDQPLGILRDSDDGITTFNTGFTVIWDNRTRIQQLFYNPLHVFYALAFAMCLGSGLNFFLDMSYGAIFIAFVGGVLCLQLFTRCSQKKNKALFERYINGELRSRGIRNAVPDNCEEELDDVS